MVDGSRHDLAVLSLQGGLGNQLFQWSAALALRRTGVQLRFDTVRCRGDRPLALGRLLDGWPLVSRPAGLGLAVLNRYRLLGHFGLPVALGEEALGSSLSGEAPLPLRSYITGYFQSPSYFSDVADEARARIEGELASRLTADGLVLQEDLRQDHRSVALHVRRGDYVGHPAAAAVHGALPEAYYRAALERTEMDGLTRRIWFSDDLQWVRQHLARPEDQLCTGDLTSDAGGEIALMSACRARVIANSTFSWWAGWLGRQPRERGLVIAPSNWFLGSKQPDPNLVPPDWLRL
jgi:hypothetical protein